MGAYYILAIYPHPYQIPTPISLLIDETPTHVIFYIFILSTSFFTYTSYLIGTILPTISI